MDGLSCTCGTYCNDMSILILFICVTLSIWVKWFWDLPQDLERTKSHWGQYFMVHHFVIFFAQYLSNLEVFYLLSWMLLLKSHHKKINKIEVRREQLLVLWPELLILHGMGIIQDRFLYVIMVPTWVVHIYCLCDISSKTYTGQPHVNFCCCAYKLLNWSNPIIIHLEYI